MERMPLNPYEKYNTTFPDESLASPYRCDICGNIIYLYDSFYRFDDAIVCNTQDCLNDYAASYLHDADDLELDFDIYDDFDDIQ